MEFLPQQRAAKISLWTSIAVLTLKSMAYGLTSSSAILSDALESIVNVISAGVALFVIRFSMQPADYDHPYGHGKAQYFSAAFEGGLIIFAAFVIMYESIHTWIHGHQLQMIGQGTILIGIATLINFFVGAYLTKVGREKNSDALAASGKHLFADVKTSVVVIIGVFLAQWTGLVWIDSLAGILLACHLIWDGYQITRQSIGALIDETDFATLNKLASTMKENLEPGVIDLHLLRAIRLGNFHHIDVHMVVPEYWQISETHKMTDRFEKKVVAAYPFDGEIAFHLDPCRKAYCVHCEISDCPIRQQDFIQRKNFTLPEMMSP